MYTLKKMTLACLLGMLQIFADAGSNVNTTTGTVNAATGAATTNSNMTAELKVFYNEELLENSRMGVYYGQFAKKQRLPKRHGKTMEWRKPNTFKKASKLQEGVIPTGQEFGMTTKVASIFQMGTYTAVSDQLELHAYDPLILVMTEEMGASASETQETLIRDALLAGTNVLYCDNVNVSTGAVESAPGSCAAMKDTATVKCYLTAKMVKKAVTIMKKNKAPKIGGYYVAVVHPSVAEDLRNCPGFEEAQKYAAPENLLNGEIGRYAGARFIENPDAPVLNGATYQNAASGCTYATYFFGKDAFGIVDPEGGALEMIVKDKSEIGGPLEQYSTIGYKFETNGATLLYPERMLRVMSCSSYSATDETNYDAGFYPAV